MSFTRNFVRFSIANTGLALLVFPMVVGVFKFMPAYLSKDPVRIQEQWDFVFEPFILMLYLGLSVFSGVLIGFGMALGWHTNYRDHDYD